MLTTVNSDLMLQQLQQMDVAELAPIVSQVLGQSVVISGWQVSLLGGLDSSPMAGGVYLMAGTAVIPNNATQNWHVVVKILRSPAGMTMPDGTCVTPEMAENQHHFGYWQRELMAAQSDLFDHLPTGLRVPHYLGITHISEGECWLWQEYLPQDGEWAWDDYRAAAYRLGQWQAADQKQFDHAWLSQTWLAAWVHGPLTNIFGMVEGMNGYQHPLLTAYFSPGELAALRQLWVDKQTYLDRLAQLPQTLCHLDAYRANLIWQGDDLVLLDWAFVGEGALGEEMAAFVGATLLLEHVPLAEAEQLEQVALAGYLAGLRAAGWAGDQATIEEAYLCAMSMRYAPLTLASMLRTVIQPDYAADWERKAGKPLTDILAHRAGLVRFYLTRQPNQKMRIPQSA